MIGERMILQEIRLNEKCTNERPLYREQPPDKQCSTIGLVSILLAANITTGPFYGSHNFSVGLIECAILCIFAYLVSQLTFMIFIKCWKYNHLNTFHEIGVFNGGDSLGLVNSFILLVTYAYIVAIIFEDTYHIIENLIFYFKPDENTVFSNKWFLQYLIAFVPAIPAIFFKSLLSMRKVAFVCNITILISVISIVIIMGIGIKKNGFDPFNNIVLFKNDVPGMCKAFISFSELYLYHPYVSIVAPYISNPTQGRIFGIEVASSLISMIINFIGLICTYFTLYGSADLDMAYFSFDPDLIWTKICKFSSLVHHICIYCIFVQLTIQSITFMFYDSTVSLISNLSSMVIICSFVVIYSAGGETCRSVIKIIGSVAFHLLVFILPSILYLFSHRFRPVSWGVISIAICVIMIITIVTSLYYTYKDLY